MRAEGVRGNAGSLSPSLPLSLSLSFLQCYRGGSVKILYFQFLTGPEFHRVNDCGGPLRLVNVEDNQKCHLTEYAARPHGCVHGSEVKVVGGVVAILSKNWQTT